MNIVTISGEPGVSFPGWEVKMNSKLQSVQPKENTLLTPGVIQRIAQLAVFLIVQAVILFLAAGTLRYAEGWAYLAQYIGFIILNSLILLPGGKELVEERGRILQNSRGWDRVVVIFYSLFGLGILLVAGLDKRFGWTPSLGLVVQASGWVVMALGYGLFSWAMASNKYFSTMVRIQEERGHRVTVGGPYRFVRHPGYIGVIVYSLAAPFMFSSWWVYIPSVLLIIVLVIRTVLEDRTLQRELDGYLAYSQNVRYRLVPGIW
jgi:protein-S-isoprenylcysteine O-methyltransferase Ste14